MSQNPAASQHSSSEGDKWWKIRFFQGMANDIKRRAPYYLSDWKDAWDYRVVPATIYMYFAKYDPNEIAFTLSAFVLFEYVSALRPSGSRAPLFS